MFIVKICSWGRQTTKLNTNIYLQRTFHVFNFLWVAMTDKNILAPKFCTQKIDTKIYLNYGIQ